MNRKKWAIALGSGALVLALVDLVHGPDNGHGRWFYFQTVEFVVFLVFLIFLEVWAFRSMTHGGDLDPWLVGVFLSFGSMLAGFGLFAVSGASFHGDGGPLAFGFVSIAELGALGLPITVIGLVVTVTPRVWKRLFPEG